MDPALAHSFIGQTVNVLEQQQPDHEAGLDPRPAVLAVERRDLAVDPVPIDPAGEQNQLVLQIDDLVQPGPEQIVRSRRLVLLRSHRPSDATTESWPAIRRNPENEIARFRGSKRQNLAITKQPTPINAILAQSLGRSSRTTISRLKIFDRSSLPTSSSIRTPLDRARL